MKPYYQDSFISIFKGSCRNMDIPNETVQCVVTSPPYWGLRKYDGEQDLIWGDSECEHEWIEQRIAAGNASGGLSPGKQTTNKGSYSAEYSDRARYSNTCQKCGAWKGAFGLEPTPEKYVEHTVEILREIRRVLRDDGVVFWNIGDSYNGSGGAGGDYNTGGLKAGQPKYPGRNVNSLKPKDLCLIPFRVAIAAQDDGWWVRSVIIWNKPNPMPESVRDRPTNAHEYILMLTKSSKYYWDIDAVREQLTYPERTYNADVSKHKTKELKDNGNRTTGGLHDGRTKYTNPNGRNLRDVWTFPTQPFPEAHFAVFPEKLPETCIKAASKEGDTILDPFMGSGTTLKVASYLQRKAIGYDISLSYCEMARDRCKQGVLI